VSALYFTLRRPSSARILLTCALYAAATLHHLYEGVTLLMITAGVTLMCWRKRQAVRPAVVTLAATGVSVAACFVVLVVLYRRSGLPITDWRAPYILISTFVLGFPVAGFLIAKGLGNYWRTAGLRECFLLGWALGCTTLTLASPFYPYPDRGLLTLQIPLFLIAGTIYFSQYQRVTPLALAIAILVMGATPLWMAVRLWRTTQFDPGAPYKFMSAAHQEIVATLQQRATENDVLLADRPDMLLGRPDVLWLAPEYPGKLYAAHFFLTVDFERKSGEIARFLAGDAEAQAAFLREKNIRFLYVRSELNPARFERVPGLVLLKALPIGSLFEFRGTGESSR
jgi:hypothetical protein